MKALAAGFLDSFERMRLARSGLVALAPFPAHLTTITITGKLGLTEPKERLLEQVELAAVRHALRNRDGFVMSKGRLTRGADGEGSGEGSREGSAKRRKPSFSNSLTFRPADLDAQANQSVKLFNNASIQVAGCPSALQFKVLIGEFVAYLEALGVEAPVRLLSCATQMINVNVAVHLRSTGKPVTLHVDRLAALAPATWGDRWRYQPELKDRGLRLEVLAEGQDFAPGGKPGNPNPKPAVTVHVFKSGILCLKGSKDPKTLGRAYALVVPWLDDAVRAHPEVVLDTKEAFRTTTSQHPYVQLFGYPANSAMAGME